MIKIINEILKLLIVRKKMWLLPVLIFLLIFAALLLLTQGTAVTPFIYTIF